jgi:hypothetical protein
MRSVLLLVSLAACGAPDPAPVAPASVAPASADPVAAAAPAAEEHFGAPFTQNRVLAARDLMSDPKARVGQTVLVEGRVTDVCQKAGCWMVITSDDANGAMMRVRMKDHGFSVAKDASGSTATIEGVVVEKPADAEEAAHFASEAEHPHAQPEMADQSTYEIEAVAVTIKRGA